MAIDFSKKFEGLDIGAMNPRNNLFGKAAPAAPESQEMAIDKILAFPEKSHNLTLAVNYNGNKPSAVDIKLNVVNVSYSRSVQFAYDLLVSQLSYRASHTKINPFFRLFFTMLFVL